MAEVARRRGFSYGIDDLDYPAVSVHNPINAIGAKISGGKAFAFGKSVSAGVTNLLSYYDAIMMSCPNTFWVLGVACGWRLYGCEGDLCRFVRRSRDELA